MKHLPTTLLALLVGIASAEDDHRHGKLVPVGVMHLDALTIEVGMAGSVADSTDVHAQLHLSPTTKNYRSVRVWIGDESTLEHDRAKADPEDDHPGGFEAHVHVLLRPTEAAKLWVSIEPASGKVVTGALPLPAADAKPQEHSEHLHLN